MNSNKVVLIQQEGLGSGDEKLGSLLMANFLRLLGESPKKPKAIVFWNKGVTLACAGSPVLDHLKRLQDQGVEIRACTTCLEYLGLENKLAAGKPTTMVKSIETLLNEEVVCL